jgi:hypothetical protein
MGYSVGLASLEYTEGVVPAKSAYFVRVRDTDFLCCIGIIE